MSYHLALLLLGASVGAWCGGSREREREIPLPARPERRPFVLLQNPAQHRRQDVGRADRFSRILRFIWLEAGARNKFLTTNCIPVRHLFLVGDQLLDQVLY